MLQEDSNGETSFEIIDKKTSDSSSYGEKTESLSSVSSSAYSIPSPSVVNLPGGNLLSNVAPPSTLPDFTLWPSPTSSTTTSSAPPPAVPQTVSSQPQPSSFQNINSAQNIGEQFPATQFSAAIPPSKGIQHGPIPQSIAAENESAVAGIMGLVKEAFSSGGVLSKMAEKAKNSVDSIITTLDPQMSEYIYSGGETEVTVTSENEEEVSAIRDAFHSVFGKAWVNGIKLSLPPNKAQAIGFDEGVKIAEEKIDYSLKYRKTPTIGIENILLQNNNDWYDLSILVLKDADRNVKVHTFTQATPIPVSKLLKQIEKERPDYGNFGTEEKLAMYLKTTPGWRQNITGLSDKEVLVLAGKTLVRLYKNELILKNTK